MNKCLQCKLAPFGYYKHVSTPGLWYHKTRPILFTLVVNNFGIKYVNKEDIDHLVASIKKTYTLTKDWMENLYCGIWFNWDYKKRTVDISMLGYTKKKLQKYNHIASKCAQTCPYMPTPVVSRLVMYRTKVRMYRTMVFLARLTKVRR